MACHRLPKREVLSLPDGERVTLVAWKRQTIDDVPGLQLLYAASFDLRDTMRSRRVAEEVWRVVHARNARLPAWLWLSAITLDPKDSTRYTYIYTRTLTHRLDGQQVPQWYFDADTIPFDRTMR